MLYCTKTQMPSNPPHLFIVQVIHERLYNERNTFGCNRYDVVKRYGTLRTAACFCSDPFILDARTPELYVATKNILRSAPPASFRRYLPSASNLLQRSCR